MTFPAPSRAPVQRLAVVSSRRMSAIYPAHLSRRLLASACFHGPLTVASAAANGQFARDSSGCGFCAVLIMLTSVNYWRHPLLGPRRTFDMASSVACFFYQLRASTSAPSGACLAYCATSAGILGCYGRARHYMYSLGNKPAACRWHLMVHGFTGAAPLTVKARGVIVAFSHRLPTSRSRELDTLRCPWPELPGLAM